MTERFMVDNCGTLIDMTNRNTYDYVSDVCELLNEQHEAIQRLKQNIDELSSVDIEEELLEENEQLKSFIDDLTTKGTGRIDLANGYSYRVSAVLTNWKGEVE